MKFRSLRSSLSVAAVLLTLVLAVPFGALAQTFRGGINGTVTDQSGAAVAGSAVEAIDVATGVSHKTISSSAGEFTFQDLPLGSYTVTVTASGFKEEKVSNVSVIAGTIYTLPVKLVIASGAETVEVSAAALSLDTTSTTQTDVIGEQAVADAPMNGRDFTQLVVLAPGFANSGAGGYGSLNGTRANQINWQIDGIDNNDLWHNIPAVNQGGVSGIAGVILPLDAVEEFSVQAQAAPESGRNPGGSVNLSLKSGTNSLHGSAYYFNRNEAFGAISPIVEANGDPKQEVRNYNYGLSVGDKIIRDKLFGFITYEHQRFIIGVPSTGTVPSTAWQSAAEALTFTPTGGTPQSYTPNPVSLALLSLLYPSNTQSASASPLNFTSPVPEFGYSYNGTAKVDYTISPKDSISAHWFVGQGNQEAPVGSVVPYYYEIAPLHVQNYAITYNHIFTPTITNQLLAGVNYFNQVFDDAQTGFNVAGAGLITGASYSNAPNLKIGTFAATGETPPEGRNDITGHLTDDLSWTIGKHQIKLGGEFRQAQLDEFYHRHSVASFTFNGSSENWNTSQYDSTSAPLVASLADFLMGNYSVATIALGDPDRQVFVNTFALFAQDSYQLTPKLNINYGGRWDYEGPLHNSYKDLSVFRPDQGGIVFQGNQVSSLYDPKYTSISPRLGLSYAVSPKLVFRAGAGLYFDTPNLNPFLDNRPGNGAPNGVEGNPAGKNPVQTVTNNSGTIVSGVNVFPTASACQVTGVENDNPCSVFSIAKNFRPSYNTNFNAQLEYSLSDKIVAQMGYVGTEGRHLLSILDINQAKPQDLSVFATSAAANYAVQSSRPYFSTFPNYSFINEIQSIGTSNYNALQATLRISNWHALTAQAAYTWSHTMDEVTAYRGALPQDSTNFKGDYSNSDFDQRNIFVGLLSYQIPGPRALKVLTNGWELNSLLTFHSGAPFSVFSSEDNSGTNDEVQRAVQIGNPYAGAKSEKPLANWLNPDAFQDGPAGSFAGTSRRNAYYAPGYSDVDFSVFKNTKITEKISTQFRIEMFNLFNRTNFAPPLQGGFDPNYTPNGAFQLFDTIGDFNGAPGIGAGEPYNTQFALKVIF
jgi:Carboxypeptidase regulatory-like domain/TonB dependent receptor